MNLNNYPVVILVEPQLAVNVGMIARVMLNFNFTELRLVKPRDKNVIKNALASSTGADNLLYSSKIYNCLSEAVADLNIVYATTKRNRYLNKPVVTLPMAFTSLSNFDSKIGFLFGKESNGLSNNDLSYSNKLIKINTNLQFSSLSIVQAVTLLCYEWDKKFRFNDINKESSFNKNHTSKIVSFNDLEYFFVFIEESLKENERFPNNKVPNILRNFKNIFLRAQLTKKELKTLYRIMKELKNN